MLSDAERTLADAVASHGQSHVLRHADALPPADRKALFAQLAAIDLPLISRLVKGGAEAKTDYAAVKPAPYVALGSPAGAARAHGEELLRAGKIAVFTVAGGQGTRLGWRGPKGTYPATVVTGKPLFRVFAEQITAAEKRYGRSLPWYIMTSPLNSA
ncbi:MAG: UTP--glucose-1-phosphate uridylyltransferase, partial [bacterium]